MLGDVLQKAFDRLLPRHYIISCRLGPPGMASRELCGPDHDVLKVHAWTAHGCQHLRPDAATFVAVAWQYAAALSVYHIEVARQSFDTWVGDQEVRSSAALQC